MARTLALLSLVLFSIWRLSTVPVDDMQSLLATIGAFAIAILLVIGTLSAVGSLRLWWVRRAIRKLQERDDHGYRHF